MIVDPELFRKHCRADDGTADDAILSSYQEAAEAWVVQATHRSLEELEALGGGEFPVQLRQAVLMLGAHFYNQAEGTAATAVTAVPFGIASLVKPFTRLV